MLLPEGGASAWGCGVRTPRQVVAEISTPSTFSCLYTLAYTSKPASACLSSFLLTLLYPSVGLSGCTALAATFATLSFLLCLGLPAKTNPQHKQQALWLQQSPAKARSA